MTEPGPVDGNRLKDAEALAADITTWRREYSRLQQMTGEHRGTPPEDIDGLDSLIRRGSARLMAWLADQVYPAGTFTPRRPGSSSSRSTPARTH
jgi:hypothetical protein